MFPCIRRCFIASSLLGIFHDASIVSADLIKLSNGGEIRGKFKHSAKSEGAADRVTIKTLTGAEVVVEVNQTQFVTPRKLAFEEYETRRKLIEETLDAHLQMADWCRTKRLPQQRVFHMQRVLEFDPEHSQTHYALGHTKRDGKWTTREAVMQAKGLVKYKGRYITPEELALLNKSDAERKAEREWFKRVRILHVWLQGQDSKRRQRAVSELSKINDPNAIAAVVRFLGSDNSKRIRRLQVDILANIAGEKPVKPLVSVSLMDSQSDIRDAALKAINPDVIDEAYNQYVKELTNSLNVVVRRAAIALGKIGDREVVPDLIHALVTRHRYKVRVQGSASPTYSFSTDGAFGGASTASLLPPEIEFQLRTGQLPYGVIINRVPTLAERQTKVITVQHDHKNREVLSALVKLTGKNFGYDERTWKLWWSAKRNSVGEAARLP